jgi:hypothetical protein
MLSSSPFTVIIVLDLCSPTDGDLKVPGRRTLEHRVHDQKCTGNARWANGDGETASAGYTNPS